MVATLVLDDPELASLASFRTRGNGPLFELLVALDHRVLDLLFHS